LIRVFGRWVDRYRRHHTDAWESKPRLSIPAGGGASCEPVQLTLPHTPPPSKGQKVTLRRVLGLDALVMLKRPSFAVFAVASILACIPLTFYFSFTNAYLNSCTSERAGKMAWGKLLKL